jgi:hypothetical protein
MRTMMRIFCGLFFTEGEVTNLGGVVGTESGLGMRWLIILGPDVTNVGRVVEPRNTL